MVSNDIYRVILAILRLKVEKEYRADAYVISSQIMSVMLFEKPPSPDPNSLISILPSRLDLVRLVAQIKLASIFGTHLRAGIFHFPA